MSWIEAAHVGGAKVLRCGVCGENEPGPGGVLCPECKTSLEERND